MYNNTSQQYHTERWPLPYEDAEFVYPYHVKLTEVIYRFHRPLPIGIQQDILVELLHISHSNVEG